MEQQIFALAGQTARDVEQKREWVWGSVSAGRPLDRNDSATALSVIAALLDDGIRPDETGKLQALGIVFGDVLARELGVGWVAVQDDYGTDPALDLGGDANLLFPMTMISKRVEAGEIVDVFQLADSMLQVIHSRVH